jgi:hypothetical protein
VRRRRCARLRSGAAGRAADAPPWPSTLPRYDHIVIVVEEHKDYDQIIGSTAAPYLNKLASEGASLARMFGEEHPSEGNYLWLFSGGNQGVGLFDQVPRTKFTASSLGEQLRPVVQGLRAVVAGDRFRHSATLPLSLRLWPQACSMDQLCQCSKRYDGRDLVEPAFRGFSVGLYPVADRCLRHPGYGA